SNLRDSATFDRSRAIELAALIDAAYQQLADFQKHQPWAVPSNHLVTSKKYQVEPSRWDSGTEDLYDSSSILCCRELGSALDCSQTPNPVWVCRNVWERYLRFYTRYSDPAGMARRCDRRNDPILS